jgi:predicted nucleic acid-binding protein
MIVLDASVIIDSLLPKILITNDKIMADNAEKCGVAAYYLIEEFEKVLKIIVDRLKHS